MPQKLIIICATRAGLILGVLPLKIRAFYLKNLSLFVPCVGANLRVLEFKIRLLGEEFGIICAFRARVNLGDFELKINISR